MPAKLLPAKRKPKQGDIARALAKSKGSAIDAGGLLAALIECWGGKTQFARDIFAEFQAAKPGSMTRQRILEMISRLTVQVTAQESTKPRGVAEMSDEDLAQTAQQLLQRMPHGPAAAAEAETEAGPAA